MQTVFLVLLGTGFTFAMTCAGAATVVFFRRKAGDLPQRLSLGFAAGIMMAAAIFSLLLPALNMTGEGAGACVPACGGFAMGVLFLLTLDTSIGRLRRSGSALSRRNFLLFTAITVHNIPEGMTVGLAFALAATGDNRGLYAATALAIGIGVQNFPEGAAIALPFRQDVSTGKAFLMGCLSGAVEPVFGLLAALLAVFIAPLMPWLLAFAAGAMLCVAVKELIPTSCAKNAFAGTVGTMCGFLLMMTLDVTLG